MKYCVTSLNAFVRRLKAQLDMRIEMFVKFQQANPSGDPLKTEAEWMRAYLEWSRNITPAEQGILQYLTPRNEDDNDKDKI